MPEALYQRLSVEDRRLALRVAEDASCHDPDVLLQQKADGSPHLGERRRARGTGHRALQLVPTGAALAELADDYARMLADRMLLDEGEPFDALMKRCAAIEARANESVA